MNLYRMTAAIHTGRYVVAAITGSVDGLRAAVRSLDETEP